MNIIIIEDDPTKLKDLHDVIAEVPAIVHVGSYGSYTSGLRALFENEIDVVILDMTIPFYDESGAGGSGRKIQFGGEMVLKEMLEEKIGAKVIVVSQHDYFADMVVEINLAQLGERLREDFGQMLIATILYDSSEFEEGENQGWRKQLKDALFLCQTQ